MLAVLSALGALTSVLVGYAGQAVSSLAILPFAAPQLLSGLHVFWLVLACVLVRTHGSATIVGSIKGLIETVLSSHLGPIVFVVSLTEGAVADLAFAALSRKRNWAIYLAGGLSSASNLVIIQFFFWPAVSSVIYILAYSAAFMSGLIFSGYLTMKVMRVLPETFQTVEG